jgi:hypothetical protein
MLYPDPEWRRRLARFLAREVIGPAFIEQQEAEAGSGTSAPAVSTDQACRGTDSTHEAAYGGRGARARRGAA